MKKIYANLLGVWIQLNDSNATLDSHIPPSVWLEECLQDAFKFDYINVQYDNRNYRIHPTMLQIVSE